MEKMKKMKCSRCGREAYGIDEIICLFGFKKSENHDLIPYSCCKRCREKKAMGQPKQMRI